MKHGSVTLLGSAALLGLFVAAAKSDHPLASQRGFAAFPIGTVKKGEGRTTIVLDKKYQAGLSCVDDFSHIHVLYWFDRNDRPEKRSILQVHPRCEKNNPLCGVFATRAPVRPNLIGLSLCKVVAVHENVVEIDRIDAFDDTPVLDIKPYMHSMDAAEARQPEWVSHEPEPNHHFSHR